MRVTVGRNEDRPEKDQRRGALTRRALHADLSRTRERWSVMPG